MTAIRQPAVAGSFYPDNPAVLTAVVEDFLSDAEPAADVAAPKAIIAPHAGYIYSGPVAAHAYALLRPLKGQVRRVVLLGPAHYVAIPGLAAPTAEAFDTPLGRLAVDRAAVEAIADLPQVTINDAPHGPEHALEVQLPFIQATLGDVALVPLAVGHALQAEVSAVLARLWGAADTLIVISSDLSHYLGYETARRRDRATAEAIEALDGAHLGPNDACGYLPIAGLLAESKRRLLRAVRLDLRNSGDTAGPRDRVVGYGAWGFS